MSPIAYVWLEFIVTCKAGGSLDVARTTAVFVVSISADTGVFTNGCTAISAVTTAGTTDAAVALGALLPPPPPQATVTTHKAVARIERRQLAFGIFITTLSKNYCCDQLKVPGQCNTGSSLAAL